MFWILAALILPDSDIRILGVGLNPSRIAVLGLLLDWGAQLEIRLMPQIVGEPAGEIHVRHSPDLGRGKQLQVTADQVPLLIDEIPALAVLGSRASAGMRIRGAGELRVKESDRLHAVTENLKAHGDYGPGILGRYRRFRGRAASGGPPGELPRPPHRHGFCSCCPGCGGASTLHDPECAAISYLDSSKLSGIWRNIEDLCRNGES